MNFLAKFFVLILSLLPVLPISQSFDYGEALSKRVQWCQHSGLTDGLEQGVGDADTDHLCSQRPEDMTTSRRAFKVYEENLGSDVAAETARSWQRRPLCLGELTHITPTFSWNVHNRGGKYSEDDAKTVMMKILNVVSFCHLQGVVHRDLKPEVFEVENNHALKSKVEI